MTKTIAGDYYRDVKVGDGAEDRRSIPSIIISYQAYLKDGAAGRPGDFGSAGHRLVDSRPLHCDALQGMRVPAANASSSFRR